MQERKYKRLHYVVDKNIQYRFVHLVLLYMLAFFFLAVSIIYFSGWRHLVQKLANVYPQAMLIGILNTVYMRLWMAFLLLMPLAVISAILVSHKIAGPLVRIKRALRQLASGDYNFVVKLREHDQLKDVAEEINKLAETLKKKNV